MGVNVFIDDEAPAGTPGHFAHVRASVLEQSLQRPHVPRRQVVLREGARRVLAGDCEGALEVERQRRDGRRVTGFTPRLP
jgi:hypothetical protein